MTAPRGRIALAFTDIEGSTILWERHGDAFRPVLERHNRVMREAIVRGGGHEVKTEGDSFMVAFPSEAGAVTFALAAQEGLAREEWPVEVGEIRVRIGLHAGEPLVVDDVSGRVDYLGPVVNRAARISQATHGGQILMSEAVRAAAIEVLPAGSLTDLGEHRLKGLERPERLWQLLPASLSGRRFPPPVTLTGATNLPAPANTFVGREREVREIAELLETARLVTLTGPGGTGKTRLSLRVGAEVLDRFPAGVWFADLTEARDAAGISQAVAGALGVGIAGSGPPEEFVGNLLALRGKLLLIVDNFEQVVEAAPRTVSAWLGRAPKLQILATSRFLLNIAGEQEVLVQPLHSPAKPGVIPTVAEVASHDATRLFVERAREADPAFALTAENAAAIATLCAELEGMPLALELAAARVRILSPAQIVDRLKDRFKLLTSTRRDQTARQRSLSGAIEWSWGLLEEWERNAFGQLCAFRGGFDVEAAEAVVDLSAFAEAPPAIDVVQRLRERSFLRSGGLRFNLYVALREFGEAWWNSHAGDPEKQALDARFSRHFVELAHKWSSLIPTPRAVEALDRMEAERDNFFAAENRLRAAGEAVLGARLAVGTAELFELRGPWEGRAKSLEATLDSLPASERILRTRLGARLADALWLSGSGDRAAEVIEHALKEARDLGDPGLLCLVLSSAGVIRIGRGDGAGALALQEEQLTVARRAGAADLVAYALVGLAQSLRRIGEPRRALTLAEEAQLLARSCGDPGLNARIQVARAALLWDLGQGHKSRAAREEARRHFQAIGDVTNDCRTLCSLGRDTALAGDFESGMKMLKEAEEGLRRCGNSEGVAVLLTERADFLNRSGNDVAALALLDEAVATARAGALRRALAHALSERGLILSNPRHDPIAGNASLEESLALYEALNSPEGILRVRVGRAHITREAGRAAEALAQYRDISALARQSGSAHAVAVSTASAAFALFDLSRFDEALSESVAAEDLLLKNNDRASMGQILRHRSRIYVALGRVQEGIDAALRSLSLLEEPHMRRSGDRVESLLSFLEAAQAAGGRPEEETYGREAVQLARELGWFEKPPNVKIADRLAGLSKMYGS